MFARPGFAHLAKGQVPGGFDYAARMEKAARAREVYQIVLGPGGTEFTRLPMHEQAEHMMTIWGVIEKKKLLGELTQLVGEDFVGALRACQGEYEKLVAARVAREQGPGVNLNEVRVQLRRGMTKYNTTVLAMVDEEDPKSVAMVRAALRPVDMLRKHVARGNRRGGGGEVEAALEEIDIDPLLAEEAALEEELGLAGEAG